MIIYDKTVVCSVILFKISYGNYKLVFLINSLFFWNLVCAYEFIPIYYMNLHTVPTAVDKQTIDFVSKKLRFTE